MNKFFDYQCMLSASEISRMRELLAEAERCWNRRNTTATCTGCRFEKNGCMKEMLAEMEEAAAALAERLGIMRVEDEEREQN